MAFNNIDNSGRVPTPRFIQPPQASGLMPLDMMNNAFYQADMFVMADFGPGAPIASGTPTGSGASTGTMTTQDILNKLRGSSTPVAGPASPPPAPGSVAPAPATGSGSLSAQDIINKVKSGSSSSTTINPGSTSTGGQSSSDIISAMQRSSSPASTAMTGYTLNADGSYSHPGMPGIKFYYQPDGSIYRSAGNSGGAVVKAATGAKGAWSETSDKPLPWTIGIANLGLIGSADGSYILPGSRTANSGRYFLQPDGSIFYEGGLVNGVNTAARTYVDNAGTWKWDPAKNTPMSGARFIPDILNGTPVPMGTNNPDGRVWVYNATHENIAKGDSTYVLPNGRIVALGKIPGQAEEHVLVYDKVDDKVGWYDMGTISSVEGNATLAPTLKPGIDAIKKSRTDRAYTPPAR